MLNPSNLLACDRFDPMDIIRVGTDLEADDAKTLAWLMFWSDAREAHWDNKAVSLLTALILQTLREPEETRTLSHVRTLSVGGPRPSGPLEKIAYSSSTLAGEIASGFLNQTPEQPSSKAGEFESILSNVQKATVSWSAGSPAGRLSASSSFSLAELVENVTTLYLCIDE